MATLLGGFGCPSMVRGRRCRAAFCLGGLSWRDSSTCVMRALLYLQLRPSRREAP